MPTALLLYRKTRSHGNFSIEISFDRMMAAFPTQESGWQLYKVVSSYFSNGLWDRVKAVWEVRSLKADLYHITGDVHYLALGLPGCKTILTIHDCGFLYDTSGLKYWFLKTFWLSLPISRCRLLTVVSEATKTDVLRFTGCSPDKIRVVPTIIAAYFRPIPKLFSKDNPVILHIGLAPNKNFQRHVQALAGLAVTLHIIGKPEEKHLSMLSQYGIAHRFFTNLNEDEMLQAYADSDVLLFASTLEGFGMPIIEAQTVGRAVITSNCSSMPEVAGEAACLVDPYNTDSIRAGIIRVISDDTYRNQLINKGFINANRFKPEVVAQQYAHLYAEVNELK